MCALAEILTAQGAVVNGSDTAETFYTDKILDEIGVPVTAFDDTFLPGDTELVIRSAAYEEDNPVAAAAAAKRIPTLTYPEALGHLSEFYHHAAAVAGVHGKTTTTALVGTLVKALGIPATVVVGSAVAGFGDRSTWRGGDLFFIAETCEYRRHFLHYRPKRIVLTSIESDHQDYYPDYPSIKAAFLEFVLSLPENGELIYCRDDEGAREVAEAAASERPDMKITPYGESAMGPWAVKFSEPAPGVNKFRVAAFDIEFNLPIPGRHIVLDAVAALALVDLMTPNLDASAAAKALSTFRGSRRRSEIIGDTGGVLVMDDYAHHPTAISATLRGLKMFYPERRLVVDFMPHTYSRTAALMDEFADSFADADVLCLHPIYASARESFTGKVSGEELAQKSAFRRGDKTTVFHKELDTTVSYLKNNLRRGDLFITLGAGDNWPIGRKVCEAIRE